MNLRAFGIKDRSNLGETYVSANLAPQRSLKKIIIIAVFIIFIIFIGLIMKVVYSASQNTPKSVATRFANGVTANKPKQSYALTGYQFRYRSTPAEWAKTTDSLSKAYASKPKFISESKVNNEKGKFIGYQENFEIKGKQGVYDATVQLTEENKVWKVDYFNASKKSN